MRKLNYEAIYKHVADGEYRKPAYHIMETMDKLMGEGKFQEASDQLLALDMKKLDTHVLTVVMMVSSWGMAKLELPRQQEILAAAKAQVYAIDPKRAKKLCEGFE